MSTMTNKRILIKGEGGLGKERARKRERVRSRNNQGRNKSNFTNTVYYNI